MKTEDMKEAHEQIDDAAADWLVLLESPDCTADDWSAFEQWKAEDARHEEAYERLSRGNTAMDQLLSDPAIKAMAQEAWREVNIPFWRQRRYQVAALAASIMLVVGITLIPMLTGTNPAAPTQTQVAQAEPIIYETEIGERSTVTLADGSDITLNTNSRIEVRYSLNERVIELTKGQGYFVVAKDLNRPFVVEAGDKRIIALGTEFDVRYATSELVEVTLVEGRVNVDIRQPLAPGVATTDAPQIETVTLNPGQRLAAVAAVTPQIVQSNVADETSWTTGKLVFRDRALSDVVAELNRYSTQKIRLGDDARIRNLKVDGVFNSGRASTFVTALEAMHPLESRRTGRNEVTLTWAE